MMITSLILGATVGLPVGAIGMSMTHGGRVREWRRRFYEAVGDLADACIERDEARARIKQMQPMHDLGVRRQAAIDADQRARKEARKAKREAVSA